MKHNVVAALGHDRNCSEDDILGALRTAHAHGMTCGRATLQDPQFDCQHFFNVLFIVLKLRVGGNIKLRVIKCQSPICLLYAETTCIIIVYPHSLKVHCLLFDVRRMLGINVPHTEM